jgi:hypothetical protein
MRTLCGCGASFKRSGFQRHQQRSNDPLCRPVTTATSTSNARDDSNPAVPLESHAHIPDVDCDMEVDTTGDYFGDYSSYSLAELGLDDDEGVSNELLPADDDEAVVEAIEEALAEQGQPLEPQRHQKEFSGDHDGNSGTEAETNSAMRLRGGAEGNLGRKPHVVKFSKGKAGAVYSQDGVDLNTEYTNTIGVSDNPYRPFSSKIEWEIARWAKTRGPSSTAFTELMNIEGVSSI